MTTKSSNFRSRFIYEGVELATLPWVSGQPSTSTMTGPNIRMIPLHLPMPLLYQTCSRFFRVLGASVNTIIYPQRSRLRGPRIRTEAALYVLQLLPQLQNDRCIPFHSMVGA